MKLQFCRFWIVATLCIILFISGVSADISPTRICPHFRYALTASTITNADTITRFESDLIVPTSPITDTNDNIIPPWGIFPFVESVIPQGDERYGVFQPVLEWDYQGQTKQWTLTPWYEDGNSNLLCGDTKKYCTCTDTQKSLGVPVVVRLYSHDVKCHKKCEPKHGQRILSFEGNVIHFTITKIDKNTWETTAKNMNSLTSTSFQTTCIKSGDKLKVGFALENAADVKVLVRNENELPRSCPGNFKFTNIKFFNKDKQVNLVLDPTIDPRAMSCFSWFNIAIDNGFFGLSGKTNAVEFITKDPSHRDL